MLTADESSLGGLNLSAVRGWMFDVDGCLSRTDTAGGENGSLFDGAQEVIETILAAGQRVVCCTNASGRPPAQYAQGLRALGLPIGDDDFLTAGVSAAQVIATRHSGADVLVLAGDGVLVPLKKAKAGIVVLDPGAADAATAEVVVVGADSAYTSRQFDAACRAISAGARFYATVKQPWFYGGRGRVASATSGVAQGIAWVTGVEPEIVGKPSQAAADLVLGRLGMSAQEVVLVGDGLEAEIAMASMMGTQSVWVRTGAPDDPARGGNAIPTVSLDSVADLLPVLRQHF